MYTADDLVTAIYFPNKEKLFAAADAEESSDFLRRILKSRAGFFLLSEFILYCYGV